MSNIDTTKGGGPWRLELDGPLAAGDYVLFDLERMQYRGQKGYFVPWLPMDSVMLKNLDSSNSLEATYNGKYSALIEPNAADSYEDVQVNRLRLKNIGGTEIVPDDLVIQISVEPYSADDRALEQQQRGPLEQIGRSFLGL